MSTQHEAMRLAAVLEVQDLYHDKQAAAELRRLHEENERLKAQSQQEPVAWRELCRRLYIEMYWCDRQMMETLDEDGEPMWTQGKEVRDVLADAKAALETSPSAQRKPWVGLTPEQRATIAEANNMLVDDDLFDAIEAELKEKNT